MSRIQFHLKCASMRDPKWWIEKGDLRFNYLVGIHWVSAPGFPIGQIACFLGPLVFKVFFNWGPAAGVTWPFRAPEPRDPQREG